MTNHFDDRLSELLSEAVSDVEPREALDDIRDRTRVTSITARRPWLVATGGAVLATAAVITAIAFAGGSPTATTNDTDPAQPGQSTPTEATEASEPTQPTPTTTKQPNTTRATLPAYFVRDTPQGLRITREYQAAQVADGPVTESVRLAVSGPPLDPDYRTGWPADSGVASVSVDGGTITVDLTGDLYERPAGLSEDEAALAVQQVVYTAQAVVEQGRLPVQLLLNGERTDLVLGVPASEPLSNARENEVLPLVSIVSLSEGTTVRSRFVVSGNANSFEGNVPWEVRQGNRVVAEGFATAEGWMDKLYSWTTEVDVSHLAPGTYTFVAMTDDPSGGAEGFGPTKDTKTIVVE